MGITNSQSKANANGITKAFAIAIGITNANTKAMSCPVLAVFRAAQIFGFDFLVG